jgi:hypothetical protein
MKITIQLFTIATRETLTVLILPPPGYPSHLHYIDSPLGHICGNCGGGFSAGDGIPQTHENSLPDMTRLGSNLKSIQPHEKNP